MTNQAIAAANSPIIATLVKNELDRLHVLPKYFGLRHMLLAEATVYRCMSDLCASYKGAYWDFFELSNGGFYMAPAERRTFAISISGNYFKGDLSNDAAGIVAMLFALGQLAHTTGQSQFVTLYHNLLDFAGEHAESGKIFAAID